MKKLTIILSCILLVSIIPILFIGIIHIYKEQYEEAIEEPPSLWLIEEQLEYKFMSCSLYICDSEKEENSLFLWVEDMENNAYYIVEYKLSLGGEFPYYGWRFARYIQVPSKKRNF